MAAKRELLEEIHQMVAEGLKGLLEDPELDPRTRLQAINAAIKFAKDNAVLSEEDPQGYWAQLEGALPTPPDEPDDDYIED